MRKLLFIILIVIANNTFAQTNLSKKPIDREGFIVGFGLGAGSLTLKSNDQTDISFSTTLPNIKLGYMLNSRLALLTVLPGANYKYKGIDRGFEGVVIAGQYWVKENWWVLGGAGLTFDAPAFYTVKDLKTAEFYTGFPALSFAMGYEVWHKGRFAFDIQYRIFLGELNLANSGERQGVANMFIVGFNWY
jgi:hypothetical protein